MKTFFARVIYYSFYSLFLIVLLAILGIGIYKVALLVIHFHSKDIFSLLFVLGLISVIVGIAFLVEWAERNK